MGCRFLLCGSSAFAIPPLFIPWDQIQYSEKKSFRFFTKRTLILGREARIPLSFYNREARELIGRYTKSCQTRVVG